MFSKSVFNDVASLGKLKHSYTIFSASTEPSSNLWLHSSVLSTHCSFSSFCLSETLYKTLYNLLPSSHSPHLDSVCPVLLMVGMPVLPNTINWSEDGSCRDRLVGQGLVSQHISWIIHSASKTSHFFLKKRLLCIVLNLLKIFSWDGEKIYNCSITVSINLIIHSLI